MERKILKFIKDNNMFAKGDKILVGVSGGADSICLLFVLKSLQEILDISLVAVHVHHGLRGAEADMDAEYVKNICAKWEIECFVEYIDVKSAVEKNHQSTEEAARILRYKVFEKMAGLHNCKKIAVAHHSDDQAETILFQIFRGSGLKGLSGMEPVRGNIVRPLLCTSRAEIEKYLAKNSIDYRTDSTNLTTDYSRNRLRNELIPYITEKINKKAVSHLCNLAEDTRLANDYIQKKSYEIFEKYKINIEKNGTEDNYINTTKVVNTTTKTVRISTKIFLEDRVIVDSVIRICINSITDTLKDITRQHIENIRSLSLCEGYKEISLPYNIKVTKCYDELIFECVEEQDNANSQENTNAISSENDFLITIAKEDISTSANGISFVVNGQKISFKIYDRKNIEIIEKKAYTKYLDCDKIKDIFAIRNRKTKDFLVVNEDGGRKKLKDYFIDMKIPKNLRDSQLLIADDSHVLWVVGYRISEDVKITDETACVLEIEVNRV